MALAFLAFFTRTVLSVSFGHSMSPLMLLTLLASGFVGGASITEVFLVAHSHCDVGWLTTVQEYYDTHVQFTLSTLVETLTSNPNYRFIWSEVFLCTSQEQEVLDKMVRNVVAQSNTISAEQVQATRERGQDRIRGWWLEPK